MSLLLISKTYSFSDDEGENASVSTATETNGESLKDLRGDVESTVNLNRRTSLRLAKPFKTEKQNRSDLKKRRNGLAEYNSRLNIPTSPEKEETELKNDDEVFTSSFLDLLDQMETKSAKKTGDQINEVPGKISSTGKKNESERNRKIICRRQFPLKIQKTKSLAPTQCIMCLKQFGSYRDLQIHTLGHIGEKPFSCNVCNESFAHFSNLKSHKLIHTGEKPFQCSVCSASFSRQDNLRKHKRIHTGEKPYQCTICSKRFAHSQSLKRHERIHTNEKRFK